MLYNYRPGVDRTSDIDLNCGPPTASFIMIFAEDLLRAYSWICNQVFLSLGGRPFIRHKRSSLRPPLTTPFIMIVAESYQTDNDWADKVKLRTSTWMDGTHQNHRGLSRLLGFVIPEVWKYFFSGCAILLDELAILYPRKSLLKF